MIDVDYISIKYILFMIFQRILSKIYIIVLCFDYIDLNLPIRIGYV
jgi:hypothetical protein